MLCDFLAIGHEWAAMDILAGDCQTYEFLEKKILPAKSLYFNWRTGVWLLTPMRSSTPFPMVRISSP